MCTHQICRRHKTQRDCWNITLWDEVQKKPQEIELIDPNWNILRMNIRSCIKVRGVGGKQPQSESQGK